MQHDANAGWGQQSRGGFRSPVHSPRPGIAQPLTPKPEEGDEPDKKEGDPSKKKKKHNPYEITC